MKNKPKVQNLRQKEKKKREEGKQMVKAQKVIQKSQ